MNHTPSLTGQWASQDAGTLLHILSDTHALLDLSDCGEYGVITSLQREDDALCFTSEILCGELRLTDPATLQGTCFRDGKKTDVSFAKVSDRPLPHACHHASYEEPTAVPDDFPRSIAALTGSYHSPTLYSFYMNLSDADGKLRVALSTDGRIGFSPLSVWFEDGALVWQINDAFNRGVCTLRPADNGSLCGSYTQLGKPDKTVCFEKLSDTPRKLLSEEETAIPLPEGKSRLELLRDYAAYGSGEKKPDYTYDLDTPMPDALRAELDTLGYSDGDIWENTLSDLHELTTYYKNKYNLPVVIFGHSYGSFPTQEYIERHAEDIKGAVVGGSCYMKQASVPAGKVIANIGCAFKGKKAKANLLCKLSFGAYEKKLGGKSFISSLPEEAERYKEDKYCDFVMSYNFYKCFFSGLRRIYKKNKLSNLKGLPVFLIAGSDDPVGNFSKGVLKLKKVYDGYGAKTSVLIQDGVRHEYLNDKDKAEAYRAIKEFCDGVTAE